MSETRHECDEAKVKVTETLKETEIACVSAVFGRRDSSCRSSCRRDPALKIRSENRIMRKAGPRPAALLHPVSEVIFASNCLQIECASDY